MDGVGAEATASQPGSPVAAMDGAELARRMVMASEAAAQSAALAAEALRDLKVNDNEGKNLYKLLPRPSNWEPKNRDEELSSWRDWTWSLEQYLSSIDPEYGDEIEALRKNITVVQDMTVMTDKEKKRCTFLYGLLASLLKHRPLAMLKQIPGNNGYEALRQMMEAYEPMTRNRSMGLLTCLLTWPAFNQKSSYLAQILKFEAAVSDYEKTGNVLSEEIRVAILMRSVSGNLKTWLQLRIADDSKYSEIRDAIVMFERSTTKWSESMFLGAEPKSEAVPMEVDRVKGDGKGKGKFDAKGKGKSFGKGGKNDGKGGHWFQDSKGKSKGKGYSQHAYDGKSKGKGKSKNESKGKGKQKGKCWTCGGNHYERDCWHKGKQVQQVVEEPQQQPASSSTQTPPTNPSSAQGSSTVRRVYNNAHDDPLVVHIDLQEKEEITINYVRAVSCCEEFYIGNDDDGEFETSEHVDEFCLLEEPAVASSSSTSLSSSHPTVCCGSSHPMVFGDLDGYEVEDTKLFCKMDMGKALWRPTPTLHPGFCHLHVGGLQGGQDHLQVRGISSGEKVSVVLDSGSDATVIPSCYAPAGLHLGSGSPLWDAQGSEIRTYGCREVCIELEGVSGERIMVKDKGYISDKVSQPLLSYGRLLKRGWVISLTGDNEPQLCHQQSGVSIPVKFKNDSLVVEGSIRRVFIRHVSADIPANWKTLGTTWRSTSMGYPICRRKGGNYIDPTGSYGIEEWPYRTTIALTETGWEMIEFCEDLRKMSKKNDEIESRWKELITILTLDIVPPETMGFLIAEMEPSGQSSSSTAGAPGAAVGGGVEPHGVAEGGDVAMDGGQGAQEGQQLVNPDPQLPAIPPRQEPQELDNAVEIAGVRVLPSSSIATLKAACEYLQISKSGSKAKLWSRISACIDKQKLHDAVQASAQMKAEREREPVPQALNVRPEDYSEVLKHNLTHLPYQAWCPACVRGKARPDVHKQDQQRGINREHPTISFDLFYTGKRTKESALSEVPAGEKEKTICLAVVDSFSRSVHAIPVYNKADARLMAKEICRFISYLGYSTLVLRCDQEPTMLRVQDVAVSILKKMGCRVLVENPKIRDHASNSYVEGTVHRLRQMSTVLQSSLEEHLGLEVPVNHPMVSWSLTHSAWLMNRFVTYGNLTPFEVASGRPYQGKICEYGEPVLAWVYIAPGPKGGSRWEDGIFLGKTLSNDMFIIGMKNTIRLTRSVKRINLDWHEKAHLYTDLSVHSWMVEIKGNKLAPRVQKSLPEPVADENYHTPDEAGSDPPTEDESKEPEETVSLSFPEGVPIQAFFRKEAPMTPAAVAPTPKPSPAPVSVVPVALRSGGEERVPQPRDDRPAVDEGGRESKRQRLSIQRVQEEDFHHVDEAMEYDFYMETEFESDNEVEYDEVNTYILEDDENDLWYPNSEGEPEIPADEMVVLDQLADRHELKRLEKMGVIGRSESYEGEKGSPLSAKFVRTWRKKMRSKELGLQWLRRSRLVAREFTFLEHRTDVFAPASSSSCQRIIPAIAMLGQHPNYVLGSLDIGDAYLMVPQSLVRKVKLIDGDLGGVAGDGAWLIHRCLPGQRDGARKWYDYFADVLEKNFGAVACKEQPSIFKIEGKGFLLIHVDDVMFYMDQQFLEEEFLVRLRAQFKMAVSFVPRTGGCFEFLKKSFEIEKDYQKITIHPETKHIKQIYETYSSYNTNKKPARLYTTPCTQQLYAKDHTEVLDPQRASAYRSLVGAILYISHDRADIQFAAKTLASTLQSPTIHSWAMLGRVVGYLKSTERYAMEMYQTKPGMSLFGRLGDGNPESDKLLLESFSDADWDAKCTSSGVHYIGGNMVYSTSRTQKAISLSSTESEWYAAISTTIDALYIRHILQFLFGETPEQVLRVDNTAVIAISTKLGTARLKHIEGKLLWLQTKVANQVLSLKAVRTHFNVADVGTKGLARTKHVVMCYMLGMVDGNVKVGEKEFEVLTKQQFVRRQQKAIIRHVLCSDSLFTSNDMMALTVLLATVTAGQSARVADGEDESVALSTTWMVSFALLMFSILVVCVVAMMSGLPCRRGLPEGEGEPMIHESEIETNDYNSEDSGQEMSEVQHGDCEGEEPSGSGALRSEEGQQRGGPELCVLPEMLGSEMEHREHRARTIAENERKINIMIHTLIENYKNGDYEQYDQEGIMASIRHMRMMKLGNGCGGHYFVRELLLKLRSDSLESREVVKELEEKYPVEKMTFEEECDYWNIHTSSEEEESERSSERNERYRGIPMEEASDPDKWLEVNRYVDEEMSGSSGYTSYEEETYSENEVPRGDGREAREGSAEVVRGGQPELPVVMRPPDRPPDDANANVWRDYNRRMGEWNEVQLDDIAASLRRMHRRAIELDRDGWYDEADRLRDEIERIRERL